MSFVLPDIIEGNAGRFTIRGWEFTRIFTVQDLTSAGHAMLVEATVALNIPIGTPHPTVPAARAIEFDPQSIPDVGNAATVAVLYREFSQDIRVDIGSRKLSTPTTQYIDANSLDTVRDKLMKLWYTYPADYTVKPEAAGTTEEQGVNTNVQDYFSTFTITRTEFESISADALSGHPVGVTLTGEMLTDRGDKYNGFVNLPNWDLRPNDPGTKWRCEMSATSAEEGLAFRVIYTFSSDPNKWRFKATFKDPNTGEPVPDPIGEETDDPIETAENSRKWFDMFPVQDFNLLELS